MLFKLSIKNIRKSIRDYAIYFVTLVLGVAVFYIFNAIEAQTSFLMVSDSTADALKLMVQVITGLSVFIAFVLGFLIVYASRFLMKRRNREFALYMILGMRKGAIAAILSIESIAIGILSLAAGLLIGIGASQLMSTLVAQLFEADMTHFAFTFSSSAFFKTILYFGIIMLVVVIFDLIMVGRAKLINLLQTGSRAEKVKMKNPVLCVVFFLLGAGILAFAYWNVTSGLEKLVQIQTILLPILMGM
ncbi:MAG: FtsX-like permease family protein, partial [Parasporobacterium sp.]|nr:FtsX-like permease family protein [Parasporobacterium sp.]